MEKAFLFLLSCLSICSVSAQESIEIDRRLVKGSSPVRIKKNLNGTKIRFADYEWHRTKPSQRISSKKMKSSDGVRTKVLVREQYYSLVKADDILVQVTIQTTNTRMDRTTGLINRRTEILSDVNDTQARFVSSSDDFIWELSLQYPEVASNDENESSVFVGEYVRFSGLGQIDGKKVFVSHLSSGSFMSRSNGYELSIDNNAVAAVQTYPGNNMYLWTHNSLDDDLKIVMQSIMMVLLDKVGMFL